MYFDNFIDCRQVRKKNLNKLNYPSQGKIKYFMTDTYFFKTFIHSNNSMIKRIKSNLLLAFIVICTLPAFSQEEKLLNSPEIVVSTGPGFNINSLSFNHDGTILASTNIGAKTIKLWDVKTGMEIRTITCNNIVQYIRFHPKENLLFSYEPNAEIAPAINIWDISNGKLIHTFRRNFISSFDFCLNDSSIIIGDYQDENTKIYNIKTGQEIFSINSGKIGNIKVSPDRKSVLCFIEDLYYPEKVKIKIFDIETGKKLFDFIVSNETGTARAATPCIFSFSPDGQFLCVARDWNSSILVVDIFSQKSVSKLEGHKRPLTDLEKETNKNIEGGYWCGTNDLAFIPFSNKLVSVGADEIIRVREIPSGKESMQLKPFGFSYPQGIYSIAIGPDGKVVAAGSLTEIKIINLKTGNVIKTIKSHSRSVFSVVADYNNKIVAIDNSIWDIKKNKISMVLNWGNAPISLNQNNSYLAGDILQGTDTLTEENMGANFNPYSMARKNI